MRILIKGGVWKNTEDEILKAAVMKYGKNAWARVASLLNRKSAKQCKARWYEWLDPSIKKTEWSKDENERLLHLAKLMPNQWRTIAPIVGRTAAQCMEQYERLLDMAQEAQGEAAEDARRLRPGEIDPAPETKPARPDPIDMDEDEKEMLQEARARLANTKGKKAKRKMRERTMEETRRLSMLQKRRELKAAGIESKLPTGAKRRRNINYATEIPFQKVPPAGFYDVGDENTDGKKQKLDPKAAGLELAKMEGRHEKEEEEKAKSKDARAMKKLFQENAPLAVAKVAAANDPATLRRRLALALPAPQVTDGELEDIVRLGQSTHALMAPPVGLPSGRGSALVADYSARTLSTLPTPQRTPVQEDVIMQEARNQRALRNMTGLLVEQEPGTEERVMPDMQAGTGYGSALPRRDVAATPNTFLQLADQTPSRGVPSTPGGSVLGGSVAGGRSMATGHTTASQLRDPFGLNPSAGDNFSVAETDMGSMISSRADKMRVRAAREQLAMQLGQLPEPEFTYEVALPTVEDVEEEEGVGGSAGTVQDAAEVRAARMEAQRLLQEKELARRSQVLQRGLPRPSAPDEPLALAELGKPWMERPETDADALMAASAAVTREMLLLLRADAAQYPVADRAAKLTLAQRRAAGGGQVAALDVLSDEALAAARVAIAQAKGEDEASFVQAFSAAWERAHTGLLFVPDAQALGGGEFRAPASRAEELAALATAFAALKTKFEREAKRAGKLEGRLQVTTAGYAKRGAQLEQSMFAAHDQLSRTRMEATCFSSLLEQEGRALKTRLARLGAELQWEEEGERREQQRYAELAALAREVGMQV